VKDAYARVSEKMQIPMSEIVPEEICTFIEEEKGNLKEVVDDAKDAKRRITAAKGPRPKKNRNTADEDDAKNSDSESVNDENDAGP